MTKLFQIINLSPDSFSGYDEVIPDLWGDIIDVGAVSTRPSADEVSTQEEISRLEKFFSTTHQKPISLDSFNPLVITYFIDHIDIINCQTDPNLEVAKLAIKHNKKYIFMHHIAIPADKKIYVINPLDSVKNWGLQKIVQLEKLGMLRENMIFDIGIGFGKTASGDWELINNTKHFNAMGIPVMVGYSRKSFMGSLDRDKTTQEITKDLMGKVGYLRVHLL